MSACACQNCERLEEEVAWLRSELGLEHALTDLSRLRQALGLTRGDAAVVMRLYGAHGRVVTAQSLEDVIPSRHGAVAPERCPKFVDVYICRIRKILGHASISTEWGRGYQLTALGQDIVRRALEGPKAVAA